MKEMDKLKELCRPLVEYLEQNKNPYCKIVISQDSIKLVSTDMFILVNK